MEACQYPPYTVFVLARLFAPKIYRVTIHYREPTYEAATGPKATPYRWTFSVVARTDRRAGALAIDEFREIERQSGVSWIREIVKLDLVC